MILRLFGARVMAILAAVGALYWQSGGFNNHFVTNSIGAAFVFLLVRTNRGRRLLFVGWCGLVAIPLLSLKLNGVDWQTVKDLLVALWLGALWFLEWERVVERIDTWRGHRRLPVGFDGPNQAHRKFASCRSRGQRDGNAFESR